MHQFEQKSISMRDRALPYVVDKVQEKSGSLRLGAIDIQRGIIMVLMAFVHSREYVSVEGYENLKRGVSPAWRGESWVDVFSQLVEPLAAGGFFMTMGIGVYFLWQTRTRAGWDSQRISNYLFTRGTILVILQLTVLQFFEYLSSPQFYYYIGVLLSLGICMMGAACCMRFIEHMQQKQWAKDWDMSLIIPLIIIALIVTGTQIAMNHLDQQNPRLWQMIVLTGGNYMTSSNIRVNINFTPLAWFSATAFGLIVGNILFTHRQNSMKILQKIVFVMLVSWVFLRTGLLSGWFTFGDYKMPASGDSLSLMSYFCFTKYPPSLDYFLWVLAVNLQGIIWWNKLEQKSAENVSLLRPLQLFGQCALFFFVCHWFVYYGLSLLIGIKLTSVNGIFGGWIAGLFILYPLCKLFHAFKHKQAADSFWRMF